jgi:hypothetical protein
MGRLTGPLYIIYIAPRRRLGTLGYLQQIDPGGLVKILETSIGLPSFALSAGQPAIVRGSNGLGDSALAGVVCPCHVSIQFVPVEHDLPSKFVAW